MQTEGLYMECNRCHKYQIIEPDYDKHYRNSEPGWETIECLVEDAEESLYYDLCPSCSKKFHQAIEKFLKEKDTEKTTKEIKQCT